MTENFLQQQTLTLEQDQKIANDKHYLESIHLTESRSPNEFDRTMTTTNHIFGHIQKLMMGVLKLLYSDLLTQSIYSTVVVNFFGHVHQILFIFIRSC